MKTYQYLGVFLGALLLVGGGCDLSKEYASDPHDEEMQGKMHMEDTHDDGDEMHMEMKEDGGEMVLEPPADFVAVLADVTDGEVRGVITDGEASGTASTFINRGETPYILTADAVLPDPQGTDFYEGWVVRKEPLSVISTGALEKTASGLFVNNFTSEEDLSDHLRYVVTLEPDDGDPAPADHIIDGVFEAVQN